MSKLASFKNNLRAASEDGYIYKVTETYVKLRRWSLRSYFTTMSNWRIRRIARRVRIRIDRNDSRTERNRETREARDIKRGDAYGDAAAAISLVNN